jgi:hypothetical protein
LRAGEKCLCRDTLSLASRPPFPRHSRGSCRLGCPSPMLFDKWRRRVGYQLCRSRRDVWHSYLISRLPPKSYLTLPYGTRQMAHQPHFLKEPASHCIPSHPLPLSCHALPLSYIGLVLKRTRVCMSDAACFYNGKSPFLLRPYGASQMPCHRM